MVKTTIDGLGANKTGAAIERCGKALGTVASVLSHFDSYTHMASTSGAHPVAKQQKEISAVVKELLTSRVLDEIVLEQEPGRPPKVRHHPSFPKPKCVLPEMSPESTVLWIIEHLKSCL